MYGSADTDLDLGRLADVEDPQVSLVPENGARDAPRGGGNAGGRAEEGELHGGPGEDSETALSARLEPKTEAPEKSTRARARGGGRGPCASC